MVKILEEVEDDRSESTSRRMSLDTSPPHTPSPRPSTSSSHYYPQNPISPLQPGSPDSSSSISSAHTFHGFSAKPSPLPTPPEPQQSPSFSATISPNPSPSPPPLRPMISKKAPVFNRLVRDEPPASVAKTESGAVTGFADAGGTTDYESGMDGSVGGEERGGGGGGGRRGLPPPSSSIARRANKVVAVIKAALVLRWLEFAVCLVSFSVMTADRNRGWALDSFDRYKEFRYSMSVNVIGFAYSGLQGCFLSHRLRKGKHITQSSLLSSIDFIMDQMLAYLLMSASSSAATRVDDWVTNWGNDNFTTMAGASVAMSFIAFGAFALSSMISGYMLCTRRSI